ncbi:MAG: energy transducer TonB [Methyloceanibacter sp.]
MVIRFFTWLISLGAHAGFALFMLMPAGGTALEQGTGEDIMVVEQGLMLEGFAKLGEDLVTVEEVAAPPVQMAMAQPLPEEVKQPVEHEELLLEEPEEVVPVEERQVIASEAGPDQVDVKAAEEIEQPEPDEIEEPVQNKEVKDIKPVEVKEPVREEVKEPEPDVVEQPLPQQVATLQQESVAAQRESSGTQKKGGDTTAHTAYLGTLRSHIEKNKINPRTEIVGTAVIRFTVDAKGGVTGRRVTKSSGSKVLDDAALASIEKAAPFPPIPRNLERRQLEISVPFKFTVR